MKVGTTQTGVTADTDASASEALVCTQRAQSTAPLVVSHLEQSDVTQLVHLTERHSGDVQSTHQVNPLASVCLFENTSCKQISTF